MWLATSPRTLSCTKTTESAPPTPEANRIKFGSTRTATLIRLCAAAITTGRSATKSSAGRSSERFNTLDQMNLKLPLLYLWLFFSPALFFSLWAADLADSNEVASKLPVVTGPEIWRDPAQPRAARVRDLVSRLTLEEKASQLLANPPAIARL